MSAKAILVFIGLWYTLKIILLTMIGGVSMASVEGVADVAAARKSIVFAISPAFVYLLGAMIYGLTAAQSKDTTAIELGIQKAFLFHLGWFALCLVHFLLDPLLPAEFSFHDGAAATTIRHLGAALPYLLLSVMIFVWLQRKAKSSGPSRQLE